MHGDMILLEVESALKPASGISAFAYIFKYVKSISFAISANEMSEILGILVMFY